MIRATRLTLRRGTKTLLEGASFDIHPGEHVAIVGPNGAGKSSLLALIRGEREPDAGELVVPASWRIASVEQIVQDTDRPARSFVLDGDQVLRHLQARRAAVSPDQGMRIAELEAALVDAQAWSAPARAEQLLAGLGFAPSDWMRPVAHFSGGWQMRIALARALMMPSDLLLLDEPTNHLDLDAMLWLEQWLASYRGTAVLVSHDTEFLDATAQNVLHFEQRQLVRYRGNHAAFLDQRAEQQRVDQRTRARQQQEIQHMQAFIDRFRAKATKARQAQSRMKALARMQKLAPLHTDASIEIHLPAPERAPDILLHLDEATLGYRNAPDAPVAVLPQVSLTVRASSRIGILGVNGAGKSTLVKSLAGALAPLSGSRIPARGLQIGYFAQQQLDSLDPEQTALQHFRSTAPQTPDQPLRDFLGRFGFSGETVNQRVASFSGGERARLALALIVWHKPNLLLLDEPSNHLDTDTREALARALAEFPGGLLLVSHDRHLLRTTVDAFWIVTEGQVVSFDGDLDDYRDWLRERGARTRAAESETAGAPEPSRKQQRQAQAALRQQTAARRRPLQQRLSRIDKQMAALQDELTALNREMSAPEFYTDACRETRPAILATHGELSKALTQVENEWLDVQEALEQIDREATEPASGSEPS